MILALLMPFAFADDSNNVQHIADFGAERAKLVAEMAADQARVDQIDGELARLKSAGVPALETPPTQVSRYGFVGVIVDAGPVEQIQSVLSVSALGPFYTCEAGETFNVVGKFTLRNGVVISDSFNIDAGAPHPPTIDSACFDTALRSIVFDHWQGVSNVNFIFQ